MSTTKENKSNNMAAEKKEAKAKATKEAKAARNKAYYEANKERIQEQRAPNRPAENKAYYDANKEKIKERKDKRMEETKPAREEAEKRAKADTVANAHIGRFCQFQTCPGYWRHGVVKSYDRDTLEHRISYVGKARTISRHLNINKEIDDEKFEIIGVEDYNPLFGTAVAEDYVEDTCHVCGTEVNADNFYRDEWNCKYWDMCHDCGMAQDICGTCHENFDQCDCGIPTETVTPNKLKLKVKLTAGEKKGWGW